MPIARMLKADLLLPNATPEMATLAPQKTEPRRWAGLRYLPDLHLAQVGDNSPLRLTVKVNAGC